MHGIMDRAQGRTSVLAVRNATAKLAENLASATGSPARVISIGSDSSTVTLNVGQDQGVRMGAEFVIDNGAQPAFERIDSGLRTEVTVARVVQVGKSSSVCEFYRLSYRIGKKAEPEESEKKVDNVAGALLDPVTALVYGTPYSRIKD
jgi:hypothetical protein